MNKQQADQLLQHAETNYQLSFIEDDKTWFLVKDQILPKELRTKDYAGLETFYVFEEEEIDELLSYIKAHCLEAAADAELKNNLTLLKQGKLLFPLRWRAK